MQKSDTNQAVKTTRRRVQSSTTLNRKYVQRPVRTTDATVKVKRSSQIKHFNTPAISQAQVKIEAPMVVETHPIQKTAKQKMQARNNAKQINQEQKLSAKEIKDQAIKKALAVANTPLTENIKTSAKGTMKEKSKIHFGFGRVLLALTCATVAVFAIVYFVNLNMPDVSLKVAAMQTGIDASYPGYVPRGYFVTSITSEEKKVSIDFNNSETGDSFSLTEEKSSWDSNALLSNFVKETYKENYTIIREQGLTIYVSGSNASWVNGGVFYRIDASGDNLTNKQIRSIAVSL